MVGSQGIGGAAFELIQEQVDVNGLIIYRGPLIDATLIWDHSKPPISWRPSVDPDTSMAPGEEGALWIRGLCDGGPRQ